MTEENLLNEEEAKVVDVIKALLKDYSEQVNKAITTHYNSYNKGVEELAKIVADVQKQLAKQKLDIQEAKLNISRLDAELHEIKRAYVREPAIQDVRNWLINIDNDFENRVERQLERDGYILGKVPEEAEVPLF